MSYSFLKLYSDIFNIYVWGWKMIVIQVFFFLYLCDVYVKYNGDYYNL